MVKLGNQCALVILSSPALCDVDTGADCLCGAPCLVVKVAISGFDPSNFSVADNSEYGDKLALPICECLASLSIQPRQIFRVNTFPQLFDRRLRGVLRQTINGCATRSEPQGSRGIV